MAGEDGMMDEVKEVSTRLARLLNITKNNSLVLLAAYCWDEQKIQSVWSVSSEEIRKSYGLVPDPKSLVLKEGTCVCCLNSNPCMLQGCLHALCERCIREHATPKFMDGHLSIKCPVSFCGKTLSTEFLLPHLPIGVDAVYNRSVNESFLASKTENVDQKKKAMVNLEAIRTFTCKVFKDAKGCFRNVTKNPALALLTFLVVLFFCQLFCQTNRVSCVCQLSFINILALIFNLWGHLLKTVVLCLAYKLYRNPSYSVLLVGAMTFVLTLYGIYGLWIGLSKIVIDLIGLLWLPWFC